MLSSPAHLRLQQILATLATTWHHLRLEQIWAMLATLATSWHPPRNQQDRSGEGHFSLHAPPRLRRLQLWGLLEMRLLNH